MELWPEDFEIPEDASDGAWPEEYINSGKDRLIDDGEAEFV